MNSAVAGTGAGLAVVRLVDCSLLVPPRAGVDVRPRYVMLETLSAYGAKLRADAGEQYPATAALAGYALRVVEEAAAGLRSSTGDGGSRVLHGGLAVTVCDERTPGQAH
jgi:hypothetical protein